MTDRIGLHSVLFPLQNHNEKRKEVLITSRFVSGVFRTNVPTFKAGCRKKVTYKLKRRLFNQLKAQVMHQSIPNAPCPPPGLTPGNLSFFSYGWQIPGGGGTQAAKCPAVGTKVDGKCPAIRNESNAADCETRQFMHAQSFRSCYIRVRDLIK